MKIIVVLILIYILAKSQNVNMTEINNIIIQIVKIIIFACKEVLSLLWKLIVIIANMIIVFAEKRGESINDK